MLTLKMTISYTDKPGVHFLNYKHMCARSLKLYATRYFRYLEGNPKAYAYIFAGSKLLWVRRYEHGFTTRWQPTNLRRN